MDRIGRIAHRKQYEVRGSHQPLLREKQGHQRLGHRRKARHHRKKHEGAESDRATCHALQRVRVVLLLTVGRQEHGLDGGRKVRRDDLRELLAAVVGTEVGTRILPADDEAVDVLPERIEESGDEDLPAEAEELLEAFRPEQDARVPADRDEQHQHQREVIDDLLRGHRPDTEALHRERDGDDTGEHDGDHRRLEELTEAQVSGDEGGLNRDHCPREEHDAHHTDEVLEDQRTEVGGDPRCAEEERDVQHDRQQHRDPENRGVILVLDLLSLHEGGREAGLYEGVRDGDEDGDQADRAVLLRRHETREHEGDDELDALGAALLEHLPEEALHHL